MVQADTWTSEGKNDGVGTRSKGVLTGFKNLSGFVQFKSLKNV